MNRHVTEELTLISHVVKWLLLASVAGLLVGLSSTFFLKALREIIDLSSGFLLWFVLAPGWSHGLGLDHDFLGARGRRTRC